ncbi:MAG: DUF5005 domain-containing protein [Catenulispora sp.]|nr:DUF5005 domain-containing protein [Catenulispora sp.]
MSSLRRSVAVLTAAATTLVITAPSHAATAAATQVCAGVNTPVIVGTPHPDTALNAAFADYQNDRTDPSHWTGADAVYSAPMPDGSDVFLFADTFLGTVNPDGSRSPTVSDGGTTPFINNSFVKWNARGFSTITGGTAADPEAQLPPPDSTHWYWTRDGMVLNGTLNVLYAEYKRTGTGAWDFAWDRNVVARFAPGHLEQPIDVTQVPSAANIQWGAWLTRAGDYTYVYGSEDLGAHKYMHVARVNGTDLRKPWQFLAADGSWSPTESASARVNGDGGTSVDVSNEFSVVKHGKVYVLESSLSLDPNIYLSYSCSPTGPFVGRTAVFSTPEFGATGTYGNPNVFTYNSHEHPELGSDGTLVVSYSVNSFANTDLYKDASIYRPRFADITLG